MGCVLRLWLLFIPMLSWGQQAPSKDSQELSNQISKAYSYYLTNPDSSIILSKNCLQLALSSKNALEESRCYLVLTKAYWAKGNFLLSTEYGFKALKILENSTDQYDLALTQLAVGRTLVDIGNETKAKEFIKKAIALA